MVNEGAYEAERKQGEEVEWKVRDEVLVSDLLERQLFRVTRFIELLLEKVEYDVYKEYNFPYAQHIEWSAADGREFSDADDGILHRGYEARDRLDNVPENVKCAVGWERPFGSDLATAHRQLLYFLLFLLVIAMVMSVAVNLIT